MRYYRNYGAKNINLAPIDDLVKVLPTQEKTGKIVTFNSPFAGLPLKSCKVNIPVTQEGTGDPSPDNVRNFVGVDSLDFSATGKNLWGGKAFYQPLVANGATLDTTEKTVSYSGAIARATGKVIDKFKPNTQYTLMLNIKESNRNANLFIMYTDGTYKRIDGFETGEQFVIYTTPSNKSVDYIKFDWQSGTTVVYYDTVCLLEGVKTADDFVPFGDNKLFPFGQTIYAGELDILTGIFTPDVYSLDDFSSIRIYNGTTLTNTQTFYLFLEDVQRQTDLYILSNIFKQKALSSDEPYCVEISQSSSLKQRIYISFPVGTTAEQAREYLTNNNAMFLIHLATPEVINLDPMDISTLKGQNNLFSSVGDTTAEYYTL